MNKKEIWAALVLFAAGIAVFAVTRPPAKEVKEILLCRRSEYRRVNDFVEARAAMYVLRATDGTCSRWAYAPANLSPNLSDPMSRLGRLPMHLVGQQVRGDWKPWEVLAKPEVDDRGDWEIKVVFPAR